RTAKPGQKVLGVFVEQVRFYLNPRLDTVIETFELQRAVQRDRGEKLAADLAAMGYGTLLHFEPWPSSHAMFPFLERPFLDRFARAEGSHPVAILRLDWFDARGERLESSRQTIRIPPEWSWRQMSITSPRGAVRAAVIVSAHGDCRLWLDDMFFGPGAPVRP